MTKWWQTYIVDREDGLFKSLGIEDDFMDLFLEVVDSYESLEEAWAHLCAEHLVWIAATEAIRKKKIERMSELVLGELTSFRGLMEAQILAVNSQSPWEALAILDIPKSGLKLDSLAIATFGFYECTYSAGTLLL